MLRYLKRRDGLADQETTIRNNFVHRLPHDGDGRGIKFLFQFLHRMRPKSFGCVLWLSCNAMMNERETH
jgi:hypothetical protein